MCCQSGDMDSEACFDFCSDSEENIFLTQVVKEESQVLLNKTLTINENFDMDLVDCNTLSTDHDDPPQFHQDLSDL